MVNELPTATTARVSRRQAIRSHLVELMHQLAAEGHPSSSPLIAIAGEGGTGKSTLAQALGEFLDAVVVNQDTFLIDSEKRPGPSLFDKYDQAAMEIVLDALLAGREVAYTPFDVHERRRVGRLRLEPRRIIILEGCTVLYSPRVRTVAGTAIFVDAAPELQVMRQMKRKDEDDWYRHLSRDQVLERILAKRASEGPIIARQEAFCHWRLDTTEPIPRLRRLGHSTPVVDWTPNGSMRPREAPAIESGSEARPGLTALVPQ